MLTIRLSRIGKKNKPMYRLIISEKTKDPYGRSLEILGSYNPHTKALEAKQDRIKHWISMGAGMSPTVNNLLINKKIIEGKKVIVQKNFKKAEEPVKEAPKTAVATEPTPAPVENTESSPKVEEKPAE